MLQREYREGSEEEQEDLKNKTKKNPERTTTTTMMDFGEKFTKIHTIQKKKIVVIKFNNNNNNKKEKDEERNQRTATDVPFLAAKSALARLLSPNRVSLRSHNCCMNPALGRIERRDLCLHNFHVKRKRKREKKRENTF